MERRANKLLELVQMYVKIIWKPVCLLKVFFYSVWRVLEPCGDTLPLTHV